MKNELNQPDAGYMLVQIGWDSKLVFPYTAGEAYVRSLASAEQIKKEDDHLQFTNKRDEVRIEFMTTENYNIMKAFEMIKPEEDDE